jgi:predicted S18 family serine protease
MIPVRVPVRYVPRTLSRKDRRKQIAMLKRSRRMYKRGKYYGRTTKLRSYPHVASNHTDVARRMYRVDRVVPSAALAAATGCSVGALHKIVKKGEGAFYSSGSRPNQTPQSWGYARLASAITGGKAAGVDYAILENGCNPNSRALRLARTVKKGTARKISI